MNEQNLSGNWKEQKNRLKEKFAVLTDNDLIFSEDSKDEMVRNLMIKLGKSKEELLKIFAAI